MLTRRKLLGASAAIPAAALLPVPAPIDCVIGCDPATGTAAVFAEVDGQLQAIREIIMEYYDLDRLLSSIP